MKYFSLIITAMVILFATSCTSGNKSVAGVEHVVMIGLDGMDTAGAQHSPLVECL